VFAAHVTVTIVASVFNGIAPVTYLIGHEYPKAQADMKRIPRSWTRGMGRVLLDRGGRVGRESGLPPVIRQAKSAAVMPAGWPGGHCTSSIR